jgi:hypothetical protein
VPISRWWFQCKTTSCLFNAHRRKFHKRILSILIGASQQSNSLSNSLISQDPCSSTVWQSSVSWQYPIFGIWNAQGFYSERAPRVMQRRHGAHRTLTLRIVLSKAFTWKTDVFSIMNQQDYSICTTWVHHTTMQSWTDPKKQISLSNAVWGWARMAWHLHTADRLICNTFLWSSIFYSFCWYRRNMLKPSLVPAR